MSGVQYQQAKSDPKGCPGFQPNPFKREQCRNCQQQALAHSSSTPEEILISIQLLSSDFPSLLLPGLFVGGYKAAMNLSRLLELKITHVINTSLGIKTFIPTFREFPDNFKYLHLGMMDSEDQNLLEKLPSSLRFIHQARKAGGNVLVHCMQGKSRSGSLAVAYLMVVLNLTFQEALVLAQEKRPLIEPNPGFEKQLLEFQKSPLIHTLREEFRD